MNAALNQLQNQYKDNGRTHAKYCHFGVRAQSFKKARERNNSFHPVVSNLGGMKSRGGASYTVAHPAINIWKHLSSIFFSKSSGAISVLGGALNQLPYQDHNNERDDEKYRHSFVFVQYFKNEPKLRKMRHDAFSGLGGMLRRGGASNTVAHSAMTIWKHLSSRFVSVSRGAISVLGGALNQLQYQNQNNERDDEKYRHSLVFEQYFKNEPKLRKMRHDAFSGLGGMLRRGGASNTVAHSAMTIWKHLSSIFFGKYSGAISVFDGALMRV